jgi:pimeloyl-ACP methyl ester carboxylesterase
LRTIHVAVHITPPRQEITGAGICIGLTCPGVFGLLLPSSGKIDGLPGDRGWRGGEGGKDNMSYTRERDGWQLVENRPQQEKHRVLLLPGFMNTDFIYADMLADPEMEAAGVRLTAAHPPGFKGQPAPAGFDFSVEAYAEMVEAMAAAERYDLIVGHSFFGNVLIEVAARHNYGGKLMLVSPSLYRKAEPFDLRALDAMSRIPIVWDIAWVIGSLNMKSIIDQFYQERKDCVPRATAEARLTGKPVARAVLNASFDYIDRYGDLTSRLTSTRIPVWYVRGTDDNIGFSSEARQALAACPLTPVKDVANSRHMTMIEQPKQMNQLVLEMLA